MIRFSTLFSIAIFGVLRAAFAQDAPSLKPERETQTALPAALADFIETAVDEGVLRAPTAEDEVDGAASIEIADNPAILNEPHSDTPDIACVEANPLDFQSTVQGGSYDELGQYLDVLSERDTDFSELRGLIGRYFSLGLFAEAKAALRRYDTYEAHHYRALADMLEHERVDDIDLFTNLAACHEDAKIWEALALIVENNSDGIKNLRDEIAVFRNLPVRLRIESAEIALPALREHGDYLTASKIAATFSPEDQAQSSRLALQIALHEARLSGRNVPQTPDQVLAQAGSIVPTIRSALSGERLASEAETILLLDRVSGALHRANNEREVAVLISFAMQEYAKRSDLAGIIDLLSHSRLSDAALQAELSDHLIAMLRSGLASSDPVLILQSTSVLIDQVDLLRADTAYEELLAIATTAAVDQRNQSIAAVLFNRLGKAEEATVLNANIALRRGDLEEVYRSFDAYPNNEKIVEIATIASVRAGDKDKLLTLLGQFPPGQSLKVRLIEEDALARHWIVPDAIYDSARASGDENVLARISQLDSLRFSQLGREKTPKVTDIYGSMRRASAAQDRLDGKSL